MQNAAAFANVGPTGVVASNVAAVATCTPVDAMPDIPKRTKRPCITGVMRWGFARSTASSDTPNGRSMKGRIQRSALKIRYSEVLSHGAGTVVPEAIGA